MARLLIVGDDGSERVVELTERTLQIGRGPGNDIVLADASQGVSRTHAELRFRNGRSVIVDLQSQNGTWLNGQRVQHAEVPPDGEIVIGSYRLRVLTGEPARHASAGSDRAATAMLIPPIGRGVPQDVPATSLLPEVPLIRSTDVRPAEPLKPRWSAVQALLLTGFVIAVGAFTWRMLAPVLGTPSAQPIAVTEPKEPAVVPTQTGPEALPAGTVGSTAGTEAASGEPASRAPEVPAGEARTTPRVAVQPDAPPVAQRPGESAEAWRARTAAFQTRYIYSRAALDRGDFAAAAGGFEAILREEPGFKDVPQLLLRARAGLRAAAVDVFETGQRLETAGEWLGALQKYEQARQVHAEIPGLAQAMRRVREKLRVAGNNAFARAQQLEAKGMSGEALKEFEKAVQWLPPGDPNREIAQNRVDQLKRAIR